MNAIEGFPSSRLSKLWRAMDARNVTKAEVVRHKSAKTFNKEASRLINNPADALTVSDNSMPQGKVVRELNGLDDNKPKNLIRDDDLGKTTARTKSAGEFLSESANQPLKVD